MAIIKKLLQKDKPAKKSKVVVELATEILIPPMPEAIPEPAVVVAPAPHMPSYTIWEEGAFLYWAPRIKQGKRHHSSCHEDGSTCPKCASAPSMQEQYEEWLNRL